MKFNETRKEVKRVYGDLDMLEGGKIGRLKKEWLLDLDLEFCRGYVRNKEGSSWKVGYWEELQIAFADDKIKHVTTGKNAGENLKKLRSQNIGGWILKSPRITAEVVFECLGFNSGITHLPTVFLWASYITNLTQFLHLIKWGYISHNNED